VTENSHFNPEDIEKEIYETWEKAGHFQPSEGGDPYTIAIPPPNVTGTLHIGHAFQQTLMDALIRYKRMKGNSALWQMGTDHAGIATQMVVTEQLTAQGLSATELGRDNFIERVWQWKKESGGTITRQMRRLGSSIDWSRERFTMDDGFSEAVLEVFVRLYEEGLIYRGKRLVNWDPSIGTALSDLEVINEDEDGHLWYFKYPLCDGNKTKDGKDHLTVATTRPETLLGDTAVAVHPDDTRYNQLIGSEVILPLTERRLPIIADSYVDPEFGSGCVKITPAHDFNDHEVGKRHDLATINIFNADATINDNAPKAYEGLDRFAARKKIVTDLNNIGLVEDIKAYKLKIPRGERSGEIVEPWMTDQWFVDIKPLAEPAIEAVNDGRIKFVPNSYTNLYYAWMKDLKDWCISRQQWWGHRIPAWYDDSGTVYVGRNEEEARANAGLGTNVKLNQDPDVLETWFSSALWTFATLGWPKSTKELDLHHPTDVLVTGHDIIFFWVARMIMMTLHFMDEVPFRTIYMHGLVRDADGQKMSKTKGNGLDPLDIIDGITVDALIAKRTKNLTQPRMASQIEKNTRKDFPDGIRAYGTDALRFTFCAYASPGRNINFDMSRLEGYHFFCNKLWNATNFVLQNTNDVDLGKDSTLSLADRWIFSRAHDLLSRVERAIETYRFDLYAEAIYEFGWHEFCDWYIELTKSIFFSSDTDEQVSRGAASTLLGILDILFRVTHPVMPYITEALWRKIAPRLGRDHSSLINIQFPELSSVKRDDTADQAIEWLKDVVSAIRNIRGERNISLKNQIPIILQGGNDLDRSTYDQTHHLLQRLGKLESITWTAESDNVPRGSVQIVGKLKVIVPFLGSKEIEIETDRLTKEINRIKKELERLDGKLSNRNFVEKAPSEIVAKEKSKQTQAIDQLSLLEAQLILMTD
jgi:valyl-tRNA synthetase